MGKRWYVARTQPGLARVAEAELGRSWGDRPALRTLLPLTPGGYPAFGPYIFIEFDRDEDPWWMVNGVRGVSRLLPIGSEEPYPLPPQFVDDLVERMQLGGFTPEEAGELVYAYAAGEEAIVTSGAWEGHTGKFIRKSKGFVNISVVLFNRPTELPVPAHQVRPVGPITITKRISAPQYGRRTGTN